jgi:vanillate O-demethylase monooxygenase subunit
MAWLRQCWYQIGWSADVAAGDMLARTILDEPILVFRDDTGTLNAILDRCPHRFAPLSCGQVEGSHVRCGYHGLAFDGKGRCVANPHGPVTSSMMVPNFPVAERHDAIWIWMGDPQHADPGLIADLSFIDETPETARIRGYMPTNANYELIADNIMDLSHADYIHPTTLGGMMTAARVKTTERDGRVRTEWTALDLADPPPPFRAQVPPPANVDVRISVEWQAPALMQLCASATPAGVAPVHADEAWTLHNMTPESETTTHYFYCSTRRKLTDDVGFTHFLRQTIEKAFMEEDKPMLEAQQRRMRTADLWSLKPVLLSVDNGAVRARRILERRIAAES